MGLKFSVAELQRELIFCDAIASSYLEHQSKGKLKSAAQHLRLISDTPNKTHTWQIDKDIPLKTKHSLRISEISGQGHSLQGRLSFIWELQKCDHQTVELVGKASTAISIHEIVDSIAKDDHIFKWHVDVVTDKKAPGPAFHTQVDNPKNLPVPRFPSLLFSPVDCLDFLLGELYQQEWPMHQSRHNQIQRFAVAQNQRLRRLLGEQKKELDQIGDSSAWITLKNWNPSDEVFVR